MSIEGGMNVYAYVYDSNTWIDALGLAPTNPIDRAFLKEFLGNEAKKGGIYMFKTIDVRDGVEKWYVGKANNLYRRLRTHLGTGKLDPAKLSTLNVVIIPHGVEADFFNAEADMMKRFEDAGENLANKINSPGCC